MPLDPSTERDLYTLAQRRKAEKLRLAAVEAAHRYADLDVEQDVSNADVAGVIAAWRSIETKRERPAG